MSNRFNAEEKTDPNLIAPKDVATSAGAPKQTFKPKMPDLGILNALMADDTITEIMVNDVRNILIEKDGRLLQVSFRFKEVDELNKVVRTLLDVSGRILTLDSPYVDLSLPDGSRVNIVVPPVTQKAPCLTIRKFPKRLDYQDLIVNQMMNEKMAAFLNYCVRGRINLLISGGTGTGKTTLLNVLSSFVPAFERIIAIGDTAEVYLGSHPNSVQLLTRPSTPISPAITARELVSNALRMRPDRIIVGECRTAEAMDMLQAMNTGHDGSMTTLHSNSTRDALSRLETLCMMAGTDLPLRAIRKQISDSVDLVVQIKRFRDGKRRIVQMSEVTGMEGEIITTQEIFTFKTEGSEEDLAVKGVFKNAGFIPNFLKKLRSRGIQVPNEIFN